MSYLNFAIEAMKHIKTKHKLKHTFLNMHISVKTIYSVLRREAVSDVFMKIIL